MWKNKIGVSLLYVFLIFISGLLIQPTGGRWFYLTIAQPYGNLRLVYVLLLGFLIAYLLTPVTIWLGHRYKILDHPNERKIHVHPIPRTGGIAVYIAIMFALTRNLQFYPELWGLFIGTTIMFILGLLDDIRGLNARVKLIGQFIASLIVVLFGTSLSFVPHWPGELILEIILTIIWLIGITNAFNFMDGMNGLAAGLGCIYGLFFAFVSWSTQQTMASYTAIALSGACLGFLPYNFRKKAALFLGDSGSTTIGFFIAGVSILGSWGENNPVVAITTPLLIIGVPIFDMIYTTASRIKNRSVKNVKEWLEFVGKDHFHHRLNHLGMHKTETVLFIYAVSLCLGLSTILLHQVGTFGTVLLLIQTTLIFLIIVILMLVGRERYPKKIMLNNHINADKPV